MRNFKKTAIVAFVYWVIVSVITFLNLGDSTTLTKILVSIAAGPLVILISCLMAVAAMIVFYIFDRLMYKLEIFDDVKDLEGQGLFLHFLMASWGVSLAFSLWYLISNHHIFIPFLQR